MPQRAEQVGLAGAGPADHRPAERTAGIPRLSVARHVFQHADQHVAIQLGDMRRRIAPDIFQVERGIERDRVQRGERRRLA